MELLYFEKSKKRYKKYDAIIKVQNRLKRVSFGDIRYQHYWDSTGLDLYADWNHSDTYRRRRYLTRHEKEKDVLFSPGYFSYYYLW